ncbi:hypothetical protein [Beijerinckia indica]|uniref:Uncharacterized protein n=1 Tax=Beijerinckia indica subsp. indica (strain ATCC 9039 / DSM 1715 / NCIMB 8712) TaxID=395963 RepID=B2IE94_BEII9|nr:hypothetical protein [Beijerinckia indica]ACB94121.1 hypothetical protein Bind_0468 [Beijerinckia indica subsp. indica ATCC 9039]
MASPLTILADSTDGKHFEITLEKSEGDNAVLRLEIWGSNLDHRRDEPSRDDFLKLYEIRFDRVQRLICKAKMNGSYPTITVMFSPAKEDQKATLRTVVANTFASLGDGTYDYPMETTDYEALKQFLIEADFPLIEASVIKNEKAVLRR